MKNVSDIVKIKSFSWHFENADYDIKTWNHCGLFGRINKILPTPIPIYEISAISVPGYHGFSNGFLQDSPECLDLPLSVLEQFNEYKRCENKAYIYLLESAIRDRDTKVERDQIFKNYIVPCVCEIPGALTKYRSNIGMSYDVTKIVRMLAEIRVLRTNFLKSYLKHVGHLSLPEVFCRLRGLLDLPYMEDNMLFGYIEMLIEGTKEY